MSAFQSQIHYSRVQRLEYNLHGLKWGNGGIFRNDKIIENELEI